MEELIAVVVILEMLGIAKIHGKGLIKAAARLYVVLSRKTEEVVEPVRETWRQEVAKARNEQAREIAGRSDRTKRGVKAQEKRGETKLKTGAKAGAEAAGAAGEVAVNA